jgi:hypothetical protein
MFNGTGPIINIAQNIATKLNVSNIQNTYRHRANYITNKKYTELKEINTKHNYVLDLLRV